jgi:hypothetical protein
MRFTAANIEGEKRKLLRCNTSSDDPDSRSIRWATPKKTAAPLRLPA